MMNSTLVILRHAGRFTNPSGEILVLFLAGLGFVIETANKISLVNLIHSLLSLELISHILLWRPYKLLDQFYIFQPDPFLIFRILSPLQNGS